jgi:hypothetical protein
MSTGARLLLGLNAEVSGVGKIDGYAARAILASLSPPHSRIRLRRAPSKACNVRDGVRGPQSQAHAFSCLRSAHSILLHRQLEFGQPVTVSAEHSGTKRQRSLTIAATR